MPSGEVCSSIALVFFGIDVLFFPGNCVVAIVLKFSFLGTWHTDAIDIRFRFQSFFRFIFCLL